MNIKEIQVPSFLRRAFNGRNAIISIPYLWLLFLFLFPFIIVLKISLAQPVVAMPPYTDLLRWGESWWPTIQASLDSYLFLFSDSLYIHAYLSSLKNCNHFNNTNFNNWLFNCLQRSKGAHSMERHIVDAGYSSVLDLLPHKSLCMDWNP